MRFIPRRPEKWKLQKILLRNFNILIHSLGELIQKQQFMRLNVPVFCNIFRDCSTQWYIICLPLGRCVYVCMSVTSSFLVCISKCNALWQTHRQNDNHLNNWKLVSHVVESSLKMLQKTGTFNLINCSFCINSPKEY